VDEFWKIRAPAMAQCSMRAQLLSCRSLLDDGIFSSKEGGVMVDGLKLTIPGDVLKARWRIGYVR
jgi:hypothetical protein